VVLKGGRGKKGGKSATSQTEPYSALKEKNQHLGEAAVQRIKGQLAALAGLREGSSSAS